MTSIIPGDNEPKVKTKILEGWVIQSHLKGMKEVARSGLFFDYRKAIEERERIILRYLAIMDRGNPVALQSIAESMREHITIAKVESFYEETKDTTQE